MSGQSPFLNLLLNGGQPILSNPNYAVFYPGNILYILLPFQLAWNSSLAGHVFGGGLGVYWLARILNCRRFAAFSAAVVFAFCGPFLSSMTYYNLLVGASWLPWVCGSSILAVKEGGGWIALAAIVLGIQLLSGEPTIQVFSASLLAGGWIYSWQHSSSKPALIKRGMWIAAVAILVASVQLIPTLEWLPSSERGQGLPFRESAAYWSLHPARLMEFLIPHFFGNPMGASVLEFWGGVYSDSGFPYILKLYLGWLPMLFLPIAFQEKWGRAAILVFVTGVILALGHRLPGYETLYRYFPPLHVIRYPEKFLILASFGLAVAFAVGLSQEAKRFHFRLAVGIALTLLAVVFLTMMLPMKTLLTSQLQLQRAAIEQSLLCGVVALALLYFRMRPRFQQWIVILIPCFVFTDIASITWDIPETCPSEWVTKAPELLNRASSIRNGSIFHLGEKQSDAFFRANLDPNFLMVGSVYPFTGMIWDVSYGAVNDVDRMGWLESSKRVSLIQHRFADSESLMELRQSGVSHVLSLQPVFHPELKLQQMFTTGNQFRVYLYQIWPPPNPLARWISGSGTIRGLTIANNRILLQVSDVSGGKMIIARNAFPGWNAWVDEKSIPIAKTKGGWIELNIPKNAKRIALAYSPPGLLFGAILSVCGLLLSLSFLLFQKRFPTM
jgi:Bacterial membrane protein YfhO